MTTTKQYLLFDAAKRPLATFPTKHDALDHFRKGKDGDGDTYSLVSHADGTRTIHNGAYHTVGYIHPLHHIVADSSPITEAQLEAELHTFEAHLETFRQQQEDARDEAEKAALDQLRQMGFLIVFLD